MSEIKAIETVYNGYRFRSRLEARWAVFFDAIGIKYIYEPEGYDLDGVWYLPDFYLPDARQFFEVKADIDDITDEEKEKITRLADASGKYVTVGDNYFRLNGCEPEAGFDTCDTYLVQCNHCGTLYFENELAYTCTACGYYYGDSTFSYISGRDGSFEFASRKYIEAVSTAKQARFEHGETPNVR